MNRLKFYLATFALLIGLLTAFNQTARAGSWSWESIWSFFSSGNAVAVCTTDPVVENNGDGGAGSLRQAVIDACPDATIKFVNTVTGTIPLSTGQIVIDKNLVIQGPGVDLLRVGNVSAMGANSRVFYVNGGVTATISGLSISGGNLLGGNGGGIYNKGNLTVVNSNVSSNNARGGAAGGGIYSESGTLNVTNTTISGNGAVFGAGIFNSGTLNLTGSSILNNNSVNFGGGLYNLGSAATITNTTVSGNRTLDGPSSPTASGAGIYTRGGTLTLTNSTVAYNAAYTNGVGGGIYIEGTVNSRNSIIAANTGINGPDISGTLTSQGNNLIGSSSGATITGSTTGNIVNANALLAALANNGGLTQTHALLAGSPAINAANTANAPPADQRGAPRVGAADIGAFEFNSSAPIPTPSPTITPTPTPTPSPSPTPTPCSSTPSPEKIAFSSFRDGVGQIYTMNTDGTNQTRLTFSSGHDQDPSFSADGRRIVFTSERDGNLEIYVMNADGTNQTRLTNYGGDDSQASFSPDGSRIVFSSARNGEYQIFAMDLDGSNVVCLTPSGLGDRRPKFSPDGSKIAFDSYRTDYNEHIYVMNADGTNQTQLTNYASTDRQPSFSPDGSRIVFAAYRAGFGVGIFAMNADGSNQAPVNGDIPDQSNYEPTFSPDGGKIAFSSNGDVYVMNADGSNQTRLTNTSSGNGGHPSWGRQTDGLDCNNTAPVAVVDSYSVTVNTTLTAGAPGVLGNDTDGEGNALTAHLQTSPSNARSFILNTDGSFSYLPYPGFTGTDSFTYRAWDGNSSSNTVTVTIIVYQPNYAPQAGNDSKTTDENTTLVFSASDLTANDLPGPENESDQTLTVTMVISTANTHGTVSLNNGQITYQPAANYYGAASFDYEVCDNGTTNGQPDSKCATAAVEVAVIADNQVPTANGGSISTNEDTSSAPFALTGSDADNDALTFEVVTAPVKGTYNQATGVYTPNANANGSDGLTFIAKDADSQSAPATVSINIAPVNDAPVAAGQSVTTDEDAARLIALSGSDIEGGALTYSVNQPSHGTVSCTAASCTYTPTANYSGSDSFTFKANDGSVDSAAATVTITITPVNDAPAAANQSITTDEDTVKTITLSGSDADGNALTFSASQPSHGTVSCTAANCTYTPTANYNGADSFTFKTNDGQTDSASATVSITVNPINDAPVADAQSATTDEDTAKTIALAGTDPDGANTSLTFTVIGQPAHGTVSGTGANRIYTPAANFYGTDSFTFGVNDGEADSAAATVSITVNPVNDAPTANLQSVMTDEDMSKAITLSGSDIDGDALTYTLIAAPAHGTFTNGVYTPAANYFGSDAFTFKANDGNLSSAAATVSLTINPVNDAPVFVSIAPLSQTVDYSDAVAPVAVTVSDVDNTAGSLVVTPDAALPAGLTLAQTLGTGNWTISGIADVEAGSYMINLKVTDPQNAFSAGNQITITVTKEKTATDYTGDFDLMTAGPAITGATVRLAAKLTQEDDDSPGDITKATATFKIFKFSEIDASFTIPNIPVNATGEAQLFYTLPADVYRITVEIDGSNGYWTANPINDGMLNITVPTREQRSSGGGWIQDAASANGKAHFAFSVSATKNGSPKGNVSFSFKGTDGFKYLIKSNSWQNGYIQFSAEPNVTPALYIRSNLKGSCTVQKIDPATGLIVASLGGYTFEIFTRDGDLLNPRQRDSYSITVRSNTNAVLHQVGSQNSLVTLGGGNITNKAK